MKYVNTLLKALNMIVIKSRYPSEDHGLRTRFPDTNMQNI